MKQSVFGFPASTLLAIVLCAAGALLVLPMLADWRSAKIANVDALESELALLDARSERLATEQALVKESQTDDLKWQADGLGVATARIQARVSEIASENGMALRSMSPTGEAKLSGAPTVTFRLEAEATLDRLVSFLRTLEYGQPVVLVQGSNLRRLNRPGVEGQQPIVFIQLNLSAPIDIVSEVSQ
ncbi:type II secretion system protein GspM [Aliiroseovarius sp. CAU 1755]